jgi:hypothetical protein
MSSKSIDPVVLWLSIRKQIREAIITGDIKHAIALIDSNAPALPGLSMSRLMTTRRNIMFQLQCLRFVQFIQSKQMDDAIQFARDTLSSFNSDKSHQTTLHVRPLQSLCLLLRIF